MTDPTLTNTTQDADMSGPASTAADGAVAPKTDHARTGEVLGLGELTSHERGAFAAGTRDQHIARVFQETAGNCRNLFGRFPLGEDDLRDAVAQSAVMVDLGKTQVLERHVAHTFESGLDIRLTTTDLLQKRSQLVLIH